MQKSAQKKGGTAWKTIYDSLMGGLPEKKLLKKLLWHSRDSRNASSGVISAMMGRHLTLKSA